MTTWTLRLAAVPAGEGSVEDRVRDFVAACGYEPELARHVEELPEVRHEEVRALRDFDRKRLFLD